MKKKHKKKLAIVKVSISHLDVQPKNNQCKGAALSDTCPGSFTCTCTGQHQCGPSFTCPNC